MSKLDKYEKEIEKSIFKGEWKSISNLEKQKIAYKKIAKNTLKKR